MAILDGSSMRRSGDVVTRSPATVTSWYIDPYLSRPLGGFFLRPLHSGITLDAFHRSCRVGDRPAHSTSASTSEREKLPLRRVRHDRRPVGQTVTQGRTPEG